MEKRGALIIGASIIVGFIILGLVLKSPIGSMGNSSQNRYQIISPNENNMILLDTETGECWRKFVPSNEGPSQWTKEIGPNFNK